MEVLASVSEAQKTSFDAIDSISGEISTDLRRKSLDKVPDDPSKTMGLKKKLQVGVGIQYELCVNINVEDGMTNSSPCIVQLLDFRVENSTRCSIIWVKFKNKSTGKLWREKYAHFFIECIPSDWTPILEKKKQEVIPYSTIKLTMLLDANFHFKLLQGRQFTNHKA